MSDNLKDNEECGSWSYYLEQNCLGKNGTRSCTIREWPREDRLGFAVGKIYLVIERNGRTMYIRMFWA